MIDFNEAVFETARLALFVEQSEIPWLKIFTKTPHKELSDVPKSCRDEIFAMLDLIEKEMIAYYKPKKINIASFGNYLPHVHFHIMARFENDTHFPEPMWGIKQRDSLLELPPFNPFIDKLKRDMEKL